MSASPVRLVWAGIGESSFVDLSTPTLVAPGRGSLGDHWALVVAGKRIIRLFPAGTKKRDAERESAKLLRAHGGEWELRIYNKDGEIGHGDRAKRTYGRDPRRSRG